MQKRPECFALSLFVMGYSNDCLATMILRLPRQLRCLAMTIFVSGCLKNAWYINAYSVIQAA
ncbi:MAG: hypothetical protein IJM09_05800 [Neisseriaceae bacterium]|nr:hypothetical protein [Neisseriaceae bacterium]